MTAEELYDLVNEEYWKLKAQAGFDIRYKAPEQLHLPSDQVRALIKVIANHLGEINDPR